MAAAFEPDTPEKGVNRFELGFGFRLEVDPVRRQSGRRRPELNDLLQSAGRHVVGACAFGAVQRGACALDPSAAQLTRSNGVLLLIRRMASLCTPRHSASLPRHNGAKTDFGERVNTSAMRAQVRTWADLLNCGRRYLLELKGRSRVVRAVRWQLSFATTFSIATTRMALVGWAGTWSRWRAMRSCSSIIWMLEGNWTRASR